MFVWIFHFWDVRVIFLGVQGRNLSHINIYKIQAVTLIAKSFSFVQLTSHVSFTDNESVDKSMYLEASNIRKVIDERMIQNDIL